MGSLAGYAERASIINCFVNGGSVSGSNRVGGLIGYIKLSGSCSEGLVNCGATTQVYGNDNIGGLIGSNYYSKITDCYANGAVSGDDYIGGLIGYNDQRAAIFQCYATGNVSGDDDVGGLVGRNLGGSTLKESYSTGRVSGDERVGGLVGYLTTSSIERCYSVSKVTGSAFVGGLMGENGSGSGETFHCYAGGAVSGGTPVGGFVGNHSGSYATYEGCFWNTDVNPGLSGIGIIPDPPEVIGETTENLKKENTFTNRGWDFVGEKDNGTEDIWTIDENLCYPRIFWQKLLGEFVQPKGINYLDYAFIAVHWMENNCANINYCDGADLDFSGKVDWTDLLIFTNHWMEAITAPYSGGGSGTESDPYLIATLEDMNQFGIHREDWDKHFMLIADIDMTNYADDEFKIIGKGFQSPFRGTFDGNGHTISNFTYKANDIDAVGIFGFVDSSNAEIRDLCLINPNVEVENGWYVGSLVGYLGRGTISGCSAEGGVISGDREVGGLVGTNYSGVIKDCSVTGKVSGSAYNIGGMAGSNSGKIQNSVFAGEVSGDQRVGGLIGVGNSTCNYFSEIENCYCTAIVRADSYAGGLVGWNYEATVKNCYADGNVNGDVCIGGLVGGHFDSTVSNSYAISLVDANSGIPPPWSIGSCKKSDAKFHSKHSEGRSQSPRRQGSRPSRAQETCSSSSPCSAPIWL